MASGGVSQAETIDTFVFAQEGWMFGALDANGQVTSAGPDVSGILAGGFIGAVEPSGLIEFSDLTLFTATFSDLSNNNISENLNDLLDFSYNTQLGAGSLTIVGHQIIIDSCNGDGCQPPFLPDVYPRGTDGAVSLTIAFTSDEPTVELIASGTLTPLPAALPLFATGLGALGLFGWRRKQKNPLLLPTDLNS